jgi:hypothetical protein
LSQSLVLCKSPRRWASWIGANLVSWLIVDAAFYLLSQVFGGLDVLTGDGSIAEVCLTLIATTPADRPDAAVGPGPLGLALPGQAEPA